MKDGILDRNVDDVIVRSDLEKKLKSGRKLRIKFGIDPTGDRIHLGHAVVYWKLSQFQDAGHKVIILIGDYTAVVGDNSDKQAERQPLTSAEIKANMKHYLDQIGLIVDLKKAEIRYNSEWLTKLSFLDVINLASELKVAQLIERENFQQRFEAGKPIGLHEFLYPMMQGYDSVALKADVELGGREQLFNLMTGRLLQKRYGQEPQAIITLPLLVGSDGKKMSKTSTNCIFVTDTPLDMYGKIMAVTDDLIVHYFKLTTDLPLTQIAQIEQDLAAGDNPRDSKASLARHVVARYHGEKVGEEAEAAWNKQFRERETPDDVPTLQIMKRKPPILLDILNDHFGLSKSEAKRTLLQNGVRVDGQVVTAADFNTWRDGSIVAVGKRRLVKLTLQ